MEEEIEVFELNEMKKEQTNTQIMSSLTKKLKEGFRVSIMVRKMFRLPIVTSKKNNFFSKQAIPTIEQYKLDFCDESMDSQQQQIEILPVVLDQDCKLIDKTASSIPSPRHRQMLQVQLDKSDISISPRLNKKSVRDISVQVSNIQNDATEDDQDEDLEQDDDQTSLRHYNPILTHKKQIKGTKLQKLPKINLIQESYASAKDITNTPVVVSSHKRHKSTTQKMISLKQETNKTQPNVPLNSPSSSGSSRVDFFHIKDESFWLQLKTLPQYQQIQSALLYLQDGDFKTALDYVSQAYTDSLEIIRLKVDKISVKLHSLIAIQALCYQSQIYKCQGNFEEANKSLERCLKNFEINDFDILGKIYLECGQNSVHQLKLLKGMDYYHKALSAYEKVNWKLDIAKILNCMAHLYALLGAYEDATKMCYEALAIFKQRISDMDIRIAEVYHTLGVIFYLQKDYESSMEYLKQSLEQKQKLFGEKHITMVKTYNLMGIVQHLADEPNNAIEYYEQAVWIYGFYGESQLGLAQVLNNLGMAYIDRMKVKSAKLSFDKSIEIYSHYFGDKDSCVTRTIQNRNLALLQFGKSEQIQQP